MSHKSRTPTYRCWIDMRRRCHTPTYWKWPDWGGRGITVCDRWRSSFDNFLADMGEKPAGLTLERVDNNGHYEPGNCKWAPMTTQSRNRRNSKLTAEQVAALRAAPRMEGRRVKSEIQKLAEQFGISMSYAWHVRHGSTWR